MDRLIPIVVLIAAVALWWWFEQVQTGSRARSPLWMAFSMTAVSAVYLVSGLIGYRLDRHDRFVARTAWAGSVIWSEVAIGTAIALVAVFFWRRGLHAIRGG